MRIDRRIIIILTVATMVLMQFSSAALATSDAAALEEPNQSYILRTELTITNHGATPMMNTRIAIPLPIEDTIYTWMDGMQFSIEPDEIEETPDGVRIAHFVVGSISPGAEAVIRVTSTMSAYATPRTLDCDHGIGPNPSVATLGAVAHRLASAWDDDGDRFAALMRFTHEHMTYDRESPWRNGDALTAYRYGQGVCEDFAVLLVELARAVGIDSRVVYGYRFSPVRGRWERHAWVEYRVGDESWQAVDPTFHSGPEMIQEGAVYLAQWYEDRPVRIRFVGGSPRAALSETVEAVQYIAD